MRITGLHIERFGIWSGLKLERIPKGVCVFYGPNEAGKTTLLQFLRSMLFGYFDEVRDYVPAASEGTGLLASGSRGGGSLALAAGNVEYHVRRYVSMTNPADRVGDLRLTANNSERLGAHRLATLLNGLDEVVFNNVFAVGLRELQQLATLDATEVGRQLYQLSTGTDRVSLVDVTRQLHEVRRRLLGDSEDEDTYLGQLLQQQRRCESQFARHNNLERYAALHEEWTKMRENSRRLEQSHESNIRTLRLAELSTSIAPLRTRRRDLDRELAGIGKVQAVPVDAAQQLVELDRQVAELRTRATQLEQRRDQAKSQGLELEAPAGWMRVSGRIASILEQRVNIQRAEEVLRKLRTQREDLELELEAETERLGSTAGKGARVTLDPAELESLLQAAEEMERDRAALEQTKLEASRQQQELERLEQTVHESLAKYPDLFDKDDAQDVIAAVKRTGTIAEQLKKRHQLEARRKDLAHQADTAETHRTHALRTQLLPWEVLQALGFLFAGSTFCLLLAVFNHRLGLTAASRTGFAWMGGIGIAVAGALKFLLESTGKEEQHKWRTMGSRARQELERVEHALAELGQALPARKTGPVRLQDAQTRLTHLEAVLPMEEQRRRLKIHLERVQARSSQLTHQVKDAKTRWEEGLKHHGLSSQLTAAQVRQWIGETGKLGPLRHRLADFVEPQRVAEQEWTSWQARITSLAQEAGLSTADPPLKLLEQFNALAVRIESDRARRETVRDQERRLRDEHQEALLEIRQLERQANGILRQLQVTDLTELRSREQQFARAEQLRKSRNELAIDIRRALGDIDEKELGNVEEFNPADPLSPRISTLRTESDSLQRQLKELAHRQGEICEQLRMLAADRQFARAKQEHSLLGQRLDDGIAQYRVVSAMNHLLKSVYKRYERERQPDTLRDASQYFRRMSCDRYTRIWTPLADDVLLADEASGRTIPVPQLSSGTREQVYLALRLAMAASFARRGVQMPLILDDVLVNFDVERTKAAAEVLLEFAHQGHQVLLFTCHHHVTEIFRELNVEVRDLPRRDAPHSSEAPRLPIPAPLPEQALPPATMRVSKRAKPLPRSASLVLGYSGRRRQQRRAREWGEARRDDVAELQPIVG